MKIIIIIILFSSYINTTLVQRAVSGFTLPESITSDGKHFFVSNQGKDALSRDGDGFITETDCDGHIIKARFQKETLNTPKGLAIIDNILYVADLNRIVGFNINSSKEVFELEVPGATLLNDVCKINGTTIAVTETFQDRVYLVDVVKGRLNIFGHASKPNGVTYNPNSNKVYVCTVGDKLDGSGILMEKDFIGSDTLFHPLPNSPVGFFDGIEQIDNSHLLISDWAGLKSTTGRFWIYNLINHTSELVVWENSPADIYYEKSSGHLWIPQSLANRIVITTIPIIKKHKRN